MKPCKQCIDRCAIYRDRWCGACRYEYICRIRKNKTVAHRIEEGCRFHCADIEVCTKKESMNNEN